MSDLDRNYASYISSSEYSDVGKHSFSSQMLKGIELPCYDFPSFKWLNVEQF